MDLKQPQPFQTLKIAQKSLNLKNAVKSLNSEITPKKTPNLKNILELPQTLK